MKNLKFIFAVVAFVLIAISCNKNSNDVSNPSITNPDDLYVKTEYNLDMRDFAMAVNEAIKTNQSFRKLVKEEVMKKFDGDYDILLSNVVEKQVLHNDVDNGINTPNKVKSNFTVKDMLEDAFYTLNEKNKLQGVKAKQMIRSSNSRQNISAVQTTLIDELIDEYPNLQISVPVHAEDLEDESYIATVAFIPGDVNETTTTELPAFYEDEITTVSAINEPNNAVIVIGMNERVVLPIEEDIPPAPTGLSAAATSTGVLLTWVKSSMANEQNTDGYHVYKKSAYDLNYILVGNLEGINNLSYFDQNITYETTYVYYIVAYMSLSESESTSHITITTQALESPQNININTASAKNTIDLSWDVSHTGDIYEIWRRKSGEVNFTKFMDILGLNNNSFTDTNLESGKIYSYKVRTKNHNNAGYSGWSNIASIHASDRQLGEELKVTQIMFTDKGAVEPWYRGDPELKLVVAGSTAVNNAYEIVNTQMIQTTHVQNDLWYPLEILITREWNPNSIGSVLTFHWEELDSGAEVTVSFTASTEVKIPIGGVVEATVKEAATIGFKIVDSHDKIGEDKLQWWEEKNKIYGGGIICMQWKMN